MAGPLTSSGAAPKVEPRFEKRSPSQSLERQDRSEPTGCRLIRQRAQDDHLVNE
jgi:hypothetical protein